MLYPGAPLVKTTGTGLENLTDADLRLRGAGYIIGPMRFTISLFLLMLPLCAQTPPEAPKQGRGPQPPKNLKILKPEDLRAGVMRQYTQALGVMCDHCHVQDRAADDKPQKDTARMMIAM